MEADYKKEIGELQDAIKELIKPPFHIEEVSKAAREFADVVELSEPSAVPAENEAKLRAIWASADEKYQIIEKFDAAVDAGPLEFADGTAARYAVESIVIPFAARYIAEKVKKG